MERDERVGVSSHSEDGMAYHSHSNIGRREVPLEEEAWNDRRNNNV